MHLLRHVWRPPALGDHLTVPDDHQAVHLDIWRRLEGVEKDLDPQWVDAFGLW
jgi:hypothetical protein